jgi:hypothetical protein
MAISTTLLVTPLWLSGCISYLATPISAQDPEVLSASAAEVSYAVYGWNDPNELAAQHCRSFNKEAIRQAALRVEAYDDTRIVYYKCE